MAAKTKNTEDLGYLGFDGQMRIVKALIEDKRFFKEVENDLDQNCFAGENALLLKEIVTIMKDFSDKHSYSPSYEEIGLIMKDKARTEIDLEESKEIIKALKDDKYFVGLETAKEMAKKFFKQQHTMKILRKGLEDLAKNGYDEKKTITTLQEALTTVNKDYSNDLGVNVLELFDRVMAREDKEKVPTGIYELDKAMNGGLTKGMVGLLIAGTGAGKTTLSTIMAHGAARDEKKVLQIFFEENEEEIALKHYAIASGLYTSEINGRADKVTIWNRISDSEKHAMKENIRLMRMDNGSTTVEDIRNKINRLVSNEGYKPDVVFIDYFSCLQKSSNRNQEYEHESQAGEKCMKKLEQLAQDLGVVIWVMEQTNRDGVNSNTPYGRIGTIQGSFRVTQPASFILYLDRNGCEGNTANLYMDKCRGCERRSWEGIELNNGNLDIDLTENIRNNNDLMYHDNDED